MCGWTKHFRLLVYCERFKFIPSSTQTISALMYKAVQWQQNQVNTNEMHGIDDPERLSWYPRGKHKHQKQT